MKSRIFVLVVFCFFLTVLISNVVYGRLLPGGLGSYWYPGGDGGDGSEWVYSVKTSNDTITAVKLLASVETETGTQLYSYIRESSPWMVSLCDIGAPWIKTRRTFNNIINPLLVFRTEHTANEDKILGYSKDYMDALVKELKNQEGVKDVIVLEGSNEWLIAQYSSFFDFQSDWVVVSIKTIFKDPKRETETFEIRGQFGDEPVKIKRFGSEPDSPKVTVYPLEFWYTNYYDDKIWDSILLWQFYLTDQGIFSIERQTDMYFAGEMQSYQEKNDYSNPIITIGRKSKDVDVKKEKITTWGKIKTQ